MHDRRSIDKQGSAREGRESLWKRSLDSLPHLIGVNQPAAIVMHDEVTGENLLGQ